MTPSEALAIMCQRCINHEMCMGTGCLPKKTLEEAIIESRPKGKWIPVTNGRGGHECSECHEYAPSYQNGDEFMSDFCPNCGAEMEGVRYKCRA